MGNKPSILRVAAWAGIVSVLAAIAYFLGVLAPIDDRLVSGRFERGQRLPSGDVVVVDIDSASLAAIGQWPWPRQIHAEIIDRLVAAGAAEIALDIDFSTTSTPEGDAALAAALQRAGGGVILAVFQQLADATGETLHVNRPIESFGLYSWPGAVNVRPERDGAIRSFPYSEWLGGEPVLSIPALLGGRSGAIGSSFMIDYSISPGAIDRISAVDLLAGNIDPVRLAGRKVIVGASASELRDLFEVPVHGIISGALLQAIATETLILDRGLALAPPYAVYVGLLLLMLLLVVAASRLRFVEVLAALAVSAVAIEIVATVLQNSLPIILHTAALHLALLGFAVVVTARELDIRRALASLFKVESHNNRALLERFVADSISGVIVATENGSVVSANTAARGFLGLAAGALPVGSDAATLLPRPVWQAMMADLSAGETRRCDIRVKVAGRERILDGTVAISRLDRSGGRRRNRRETRVICLTFADVTEARESEARTAYLARYDDLTRLPNRNYFTERLQALINRDGQRHYGGVLFFDLDRFKPVNDVLGHQCGDLLLAAVGDRAQAIVGSRGLVARFGGDEYAVLAPDLSGDQLADLADNLIRALTAPFLVDGYRVAVGVSIGIALVSGRNRDPAAAMRQADLALNVAKDTGGNAYRFFEEAMGESLDERRGLEVALWDALERGQFGVAYQPQVELTTGRLTGVEALIRWDRPTLGMVPPNQFIPVAEATGLIAQIGAQVLRRACHEIARLSPTLRVAVNVSPVQFTRGDLVATVRDALAESGLSADRLQIEITESLFLNSGSLLEDTIDELKRLGVRFALDDFGTGYSSLSYLRRFPVGKIKIDQSFIAGLPFDQEAVGIVQAVVAMATALGIEVNAEGIETTEQAAILLRLGCHEGQGFLYGKAESIERLAAFNSPFIAEPTLRLTA